jgi:hypothetical protein
MTTASNGRQIYATRLADGSVVTTPSVGPAKQQEYYEERVYDEDDRGFFVDASYTLTALNTDYCATLPAILRWLQIVCFTFKHTFVYL